MAGKHIQNQTERRSIADSPRKGSRRGRRKKIALIALGCVAAVALAVVGLWKVFIQPPDVSGKPTPPSGVGQNGAQDGQSLDGEELATPTGRKDQYFTFLLLGLSGGNTDTIILVSYDVPNRQVNMMSIPRDMAVNLSWNPKKINSVYGVSESKGGGLENLKKQVSYLTGVMPDFYVMIEWEAIGEVVEALGGVEFDVPRNMDYDDPTQDLHIHLKKGLQVLNGEEAMGVIRYRHDNKKNGKMPGYADGDLGRTRTQQAFLKACAKQALQLGNITKINEFVRIFMDRVETDLPMTNLLWFVEQAMGVDPDTIQSCTMPNAMIGSFRGYDYVMPKGDEILEVVNQQFNPYDRDITDKDIQILVRNSDGSVYVTNGTLLDAKWARPTSTSSGGGAGSSGGTGSNTGDATDPGTTDPGTGDATDPGVTDPGTTDPGTGDTTDPGVTDPGTTDPGTGDATDPGVTDPGTTDPGAGDATDPGTTDPGTGGGDDSVPPGWLTGENG